MAIEYKQDILPCEIKAGDIIIFRNEFAPAIPMTYLSAAIRFFTQCPYNHSALVVENNGVLFLNEALAGGVWSRPLAKFLERGKHTFMGVLRPKQEILSPITFSINANDLVGIKYDFESLIFHQSVYRIPKLLGLKRFGRWIGSRNENATAKMVCSEYCAWAHGLPEWWLMSTAELIHNENFELIYQEKEFIKK